MPSALGERGLLLETIPVAARTENVRRERASLSSLPGRIPRAVDSHGVACGKVLWGQGKCTFNPVCLHYLSLRNLLLFLFYIYRSGSTYLYSVCVYHVYQERVLNFYSPGGCTVSSLASTALWEMISAGFRTCRRWHAALGATPHSLSKGSAQRAPSCSPAADR